MWLKRTTASAPTTPAAKQIATRCIRVRFVRIASLTRASSLTNTVAPRRGEPPPRARSNRRARRLLLGLWRVVPSPLLRCPYSGACRDTGSADSDRTSRRRRHHAAAGTSLAMRSNRQRARGPRSRPVDRDRASRTLIYFNEAIRAPTFASTPSCSRPSCGPLSTVAQPQAVNDAHNVTRPLLPPRKRGSP